MVNMTNEFLTYTVIERRKTTKDIRLTTLSHATSPTRLFCAVSDGGWSIVTMRFLDTPLWRYDASNVGRTDARTHGRSDDFAMHCIGQTIRPMLSLKKKY